MMTDATVGLREKPVERNLRDGFSGFLGDGVEGVDDFEKIFVVDLRTGVGSDLAIEAGGLWARRAAANFAGEASPAERAPDQRADFLIDAERHEFPFVVAADERIVDLMGDVSGPAVALGNGERLHQVPA